MKVYLAGVPGAGASNRQAIRFIRSTVITRHCISYSDILYNKRGDELRFKTLAKINRKDTER